MNIITDNQTYSIYVDTDSTLSTSTIPYTWRTVSVTSAATTWQTNTIVSVNCYPGEQEIYLSWATTYPKYLNPKQKLKEIIASRQAPNIITNRKSLFQTTDVKELRARATLKKVIGEIKYQDFLHNGFVSIKAKDDYYYQLFPGHGITHVFSKGKLIARLCVVFDYSFTPTDSLIMRYLMIKNNPEKFWEIAVKHGVSERQPRIIARDTRNLAEIYADLKKNAA